MTTTPGKRAPRKTSENVSVLGYSLLSLLARKQRTGYELSRFTAGARSMILSSSGHSNIYKELAKLSARNLVTFRVVKDDRPFDKKVYTLTVAGRERLLQWVKSKPTKIDRTELNVRLHAIWLLTPAEAQSLLEKQIALAEQELNELRQHRNYLQEENDIGSPPPQHPLFGTFANIDLEIAIRKLIVSRCQQIQKQWAESPMAPKRSSVRGKASSR